MRKKALQQTFDATDRIHLTCELKKGNLVLTFSTAAFESFRSILRNCANHSSFSGFNFEAEIRFSKDKTASAEEAYSVKRDSRQLYKINLYLTTSRVNINGANINIFIDDHFPLIISEMKVHGNFSDLNNILKDSLMNSLKIEENEVANINKSVNKLNEKSSSIRNRKCSNIVPLDKKKICVSDAMYLLQIDGNKSAHDSNLPIDYTNNPKVDGTDINCLVCDQECQDEAVYCDCCNTWIHYKCEKLSKSDIKYFKQTPSELYTCMVCMDLLMFDSYNRDNTNIEIIQTSPDIAIAKDKQSNVQTSPDIVITKNKQSNVHSVPTILQPKTQNMETNTDMGLKDLDKLEELQRVQKRLTSREKEISTKEKAIKEKEQDLNEVTLKLASAQTYILNLEKRINDMESSILYKKTGPNITTSNDDGDRLISTTLERRLIEIEHKLSETYRAPPCYQVPNIVINNNIDGNKSETATSKYEVKQNTNCTQTQTDSVNLNMTQNSTYNDENLVDDNINCQPHPSAVNLSHILNLNQMRSADISYQRNQQNPENKSYTSIPDNKQNHFLGKRKQNRPSYPNPQHQRPAIQYYTGMPLYQRSMWRTSHPMPYTFNKF